MSALCAEAVSVIKACALIKHDLTGATALGNDSLTLLNSHVHILWCSRCIEAFILLDK